MHKNILITGGLGFIGSNFIELLRSKTKANIINVDKLTHKFFLINAKKLNKIKDYHYYNIDINNKNQLDKIYSIHKIDLVFNFAAESHVDNSILNPLKFVKSNITGTVNLLEISYKHWKKNTELDNNLFIQISTDEVYGSIPLKSKRKFKETDKLNPNSPYSSTKAAAELIVKSFNQTYGLRTIITNSSNNYGPGQHPEKLIPKSITNLINNKNITLYGNGKNIRDWIYVKDNAYAIYMIYRKGLSNNNYLIGGNNCMSNNEIADIIINKYNKIFNKIKKKQEVKEYITDRLGHDLKYDLSTFKIEKLGIIIDKKNFNSNITTTIKWYNENKKAIKKYM